MSDKLVFDLSQEIEGTPSVFVRKDWLNILDNQNQNYSNNQSIIDTSQLSNSNKYMSYRESYLSIPMVLTMAQTALPVYSTLTTDQPIADALAPKFGTNVLDSCVGLKNWFGQIIHSMTLDYNGTTIVQQTPFLNMWNSFKLMTSLSWQDVKSQGTTIGFYPDDGDAFIFNPAGVGTSVVLAPTPTATDTMGDWTCGNGTVNNLNWMNVANSNAGQCYQSGSGNIGFKKRLQMINFDGDTTLGSSGLQQVPLANGAATTAAGANAFVAAATSFSSYDNTKLSYATYGSLLNGGNQTYVAGAINAGATLNLLWKSYIISKRSGTVATINAGAPATGVLGFIQFGIIANVYLKHLHSFFNMCPLLKGVFMKMTLNLNNASSTIKVAGTTATVGGLICSSGLGCSAVSVPIGGVNPIMVASAGLYEGSDALIGNALTNVSTAAGTVVTTFVTNLSVGGTCLDQTILSSITSGLGTNASRSVYLYIPAYTFNPVFEQAYLSSPVKQIKYTDIYQYQILNVTAGQTFNNLITNGIANIRSILLLPFYSASGTLANVAGTGSATSGNTIVNTKLQITNSVNTGFVSGVPVWQSPFDPAGTGPTSPLSHITNFNVQVSGQNAIYNLQKYNFEQFNNQLYGQNAVNGGLTDGLTSSLIDRQAFDMEYCYYYVNIERMLPVETSVPKSIQVIGQNMSSRAMDYWVFIEYGVEISIDALTGARV